jgi:hypothetical protein
MGCPALVAAARWLADNGRFIKELRHLLFFFNIAGGRLFAAPVRPFP